MYVLDIIYYIYIYILLVYYCGLQCYRHLSLTNELVMIATIETAQRVQLTP